MIPHRGPETIGQPGGAEPLIPDPEDVIRFFPPRPRSGPRRDRTDPRNRIVYQGVGFSLALPFRRPLADFHPGAGYSGPRGPVVLPAREPLPFTSPLVN